LTHPLIYALGLGYGLDQNPEFDLQDLVDKVFNLGPKKFDEPVAVEPPDFMGGDDPADFAAEESARLNCERVGGSYNSMTGFCDFRGRGGKTPPGGTEEIPQDPEPGTDMPPEMEMALGMESTQTVELTPPRGAGMALQGETVFENGEDVFEAVTSAIAGLTAADLRARTRRTSSIQPEEGFEIP